MGHAGVVIHHDARMAGGAFLEAGRMSRRIHVAARRRTARRMPGRRTASVPRESQA